jgi:hypothetical protein
LVKEVTGFNGWYAGAQLDFLLQAQKAIEDNNNRYVQCLIFIIYIGYAGKLMEIKYATYIS